MGGMCLAALFAFAGMGIGTVVYGGFAIGLIASGGFAAGIVVLGGFSVGLWAEGAMAISYFEFEEAPKIIKAILMFIGEGRRLFILFPLLLTSLLLILMAASNIVIYRENKRLREMDPWLLG
jgi:hypothetical protein